MVKGTPELIAERREEIMNVCERLYQTKSFKEITLKEIGAETPFSRPTIYNYFETKEEIFLALFEREYWNWTEDLNVILGETHADRRTLAEALAQSLQKRTLMLKLLAVNLYDMEGHSRPERLVSFKRAYGASLSAMGAILAQSFPELDAGARQMLLLTVMQFLHGVYPYAYATEKQKAAMEEAGVSYVPHTVYELAYAGLNRLFGN